MVGLFKGGSSSKGLDPGVGGVEGLVEGVEVEG